MFRCGYNYLVNQSESWSVIYTIKSPSADSVLFIADLPELFVLSLVWNRIWDIFGITCYHCLQRHTRL